VFYSASALESFTGGLGTAAFLAFLMAIVDKRHSATEFALLSSVFAPARANVSHRQGEQPEGETMTATAAWCHSTP